MNRLLVIGLLLTIAGCAGTARHVRSVGETGWATVRCETQPDGSVKNCVVVGESRPDAGYGEAAIEAVEQGRLSARTMEGATAGAAFTTTVQFREDDASATSPK